MPSGSRTLRAGVQRLGRGPAWDNCRRSRKKRSKPSKRRRGLKCQERNGTACERTRRRRVKDR
eukprot:9466574-Alexandrium_andersonii.AAC.1